VNVKLRIRNEEFGIRDLIPSSEALVPPSTLAWSVWGVAATYYLAAFYLRSAPAVMTTELMRDFGIKASQLGQFSAFYFYAYILMQIPTGVLVDSWGARRLLIAGSLAEARAAVATSTFDLILADYRLTDGEVLSIVPELRASAGCIVVMSGMPDLAEHCRGVGVDRILTKPFLPAHLDALLADVAAAKEAGAERVCVGLGVSNAEQVSEIAAYADGVIVGTALVSAVKDGGVDAVAKLTKDLSTGLTRK